MVDHLLVAEKVMYVLREYTKKYRLHADRIKVINVHLSGDGIDLETAKEIHRQLGLHTPAVVQLDAKPTEYVFRFPAKGK